MLIKRYNQIKVPMIMNLFLIVIVSVTTVPPLVTAVETRKLDETTGPPPGEKCTPCGNSSPPPSPPDYPSPPPPPPYYPSPPPPPPYYYSSPPPPKKTPSSQYCPPPPAAFLYITGPPGNLYPVDENFNGASRRSFTAALPLLVGLLTVLGLW